jgi:hypothetical protein
MQLRIQLQFILLLLIAGNGYAQSGAEIARPPLPGATDLPALRSGEAPTSPVGSETPTQPSTTPDPLPDDPSNQRFDTGAAGSQPAPQPLPIFSLLPNLKVLLGGTVTADFIYSSQRVVAPGTPFFLTPASPTGASTQTFDALARQSAVFAVFQGPEFCGFETGGVVVATFYASDIVTDLYGFLPFEAFGHLKNEDWRFAAGLQLDIFNPRLPTVLPFSMLLGSGNVGAYRGQARVERFLYPGDESQITLQAGVSEPIATFITDEFRISEDNGAPNLEGRAMFGLGEQKGQGLLAHRPFEIAVSGVVGKFRTVDLTKRVVASVWGFGSDWRWEVTEKFGTKGEFYVGQGLGTYGGAVLQTINSSTFAPIWSIGGWFELYYYLLPQLHTHVGYGIDSPQKTDLAAGQVSRNDTLFANLIWDATKTLRLGLEGTYRQTDYVTLLNNQGFTVQTQVQWKF